MCSGNISGNLRCIDHNVLPLCLRGLGTPIKPPMMLPWTSSGHVNAACLTPTTGLGEMPKWTRSRTALAQNEAHDAGGQGSPMDEDPSNSGDDSDNYDEFAETIFESRSTVAAQNDANDTGNQNPMSQSPLLSIHGKIDGSRLDGRVGSSVSMGALHNGAGDAVKQVSPMDHVSPMGQVPPTSDHHRSNEGSPMSQCSSWSDSLFGDHSDVTESTPLSHYSTAAQNDAPDVVNETSTMHRISPIGQVPPGFGCQSSNRGSPIGQDSPSSNYGSDDQSHVVLTPPSSRSSGTSQENVCDAGCQTFPMPPPPREDHFNGIPSYAAEALRSTIKISLSTLCSDFMATAQSDLPRARRDLDELKEIANQYFSATEGSFDITHDRTES
ncbi:hypothetical protein VE03_04600 [Pseudogymnoascus sp. 23342-1-I1]|nr:hypothetical protein VE03_04600 [Pseudogymnoascus sp. 23342-1-I1]